MNLFVLDENPREAAAAHSDVHVRKMVIETAQMLSTAHRILDSPGKTWNSETNRFDWRLGNQTFDRALYRVTHLRHPCNLWVRECSGNYLWAMVLFIALAEEFETRYGKPHATEVRVMPYLESLPRGIAMGSRTEFVTAMPDEYVVPDDPVESYRNYYRHGKTHVHGWKTGRVPAWL